MGAARSGVTRGAIDVAVVEHGLEVLAPIFLLGFGKEVIGAYVIVVGTRTRERSTKEGPHVVRTVGPVLVHVGREDLEEKLHHERHRAEGRRLTPTPRARPTISSGRRSAHRGRALVAAPSALAEHGRNEEDTRSGRHQERGSTCLMVSNSPRGWPRGRCASRQRTLSRPEENW